MAFVANNPQVKSILKTTAILSALTICEFILVGIKVPLAGWLGWDLDTVVLAVNLTLIIMTLFKAYYIVAEFMHLGHEIRRLILSVLIPFIFIVWLIIGMIIEGNYYGKETKKAYEPQGNLQSAPAQVDHGTQFAVVRDDIVVYGG